MLEKITNLFNKLERVITRVTAIMIILLSILVSWQVFARYVLNTGQFWAEEVSITTMMWIAFLGASGGIWTNSHIGLRFFVGLLPDKVKKIIDIINFLIISIFSLLLFNYGIILVQKTMSGRLSATNIPIGYAYVIIPISTAFMVIFSLWKSFHALLTFYHEHKVK